MKIARVTNISDSIEKLKEAGLWICGTDINTEKYYYNQDLTGSSGIIIYESVKQRILKKSID